MAAEQFIGWRYLFWRRGSALVRNLTIVFGSVLVGSLILFLLTHRAYYAFSSVFSLIFFVAYAALNFFSVFSTISMLGVLLGVAALVVVSSVTSGFQASFKDKVLGVNAHIIVLRYGQDFSQYRDVIKTVSAEPHVIGAAPFVLNVMMLAANGVSSGVQVKGIDPAQAIHVNDVGQRMVVGKLDDLKIELPPNDNRAGPPLPAIFVGKELQRKLRLKIGDRVRAVSAKSDFDPSEWTAGGGAAPEAREFRVGGVFYSGFDEYDRHLSYVLLKEAQKFGKAGDVVTGVELKLDRVDVAKKLADKIQADLGGIPYRVIDWEALNHNLFTALAMQKVALLIFLTLIIVVAAFNIVAAMTTLVIDKTKDIASLKSMGVSSGAIAGVFQVAGLSIGGLGVLSGVVVGLFVCFVVQRYGYTLDAKVYLIDRLPVQVSPFEVAAVALETMGICFAATLYPSLRAAGLRPVDGLRME